jgi:hypothetical protein
MVSDIMIYVEGITNSLHVSEVAAKVDHHRVVHAFCAPANYVMDGKIH